MRITYVRFLPYLVLSGYSCADTDLIKLVCLISSIHTIADCHVLQVIKGFGAICDKLKEHAQIVVAPRPDQRSLASYNINAIDEETG